jgi:signal transduction histidine kinase
METWNYIAAIFDAINLGLGVCLARLIQEKKRTNREFEEKARAEKDLLSGILHSFHQRFSIADSDHSPFIMDIEARIAAIRDQAGGGGNTLTAVAVEHQLNAIRDMIKTEVYGLWESVVSSVVDGKEVQMSLHSYEATAVPFCAVERFERFASSQDVGPIAWQIAKSAFEGGPSYDAKILTKKGVEISLHSRVVGRLSGQVRFSAAFFEAISNALANSHKYAPRVGGRIKLEIEINATEKIIKAVVADNGAGIPIDKAKRLYHTRIASASGGMGSARPTSDEPSEAKAVKSL